MQAKPDDRAPVFPSKLEAVSFRFEDVVRLASRRVDVSVQEHGLSRPQWRLLAYVMRCDGMTQSELARALDLERATVGQTIDAMEQKQLVVRRRSDGDRRSWRIAATDKAHEILPILRLGVDEIMAQWFSGFSHEDIELLSSLLDRLILNLEEL